MKGILRVLGDLLDYLWKTKQMWLLPLFLLMIIIGLLVSASSTSAIPIFIYPLV